MSRRNKGKKASKAVKRLLNGSNDKWSSGRKKLGKGGRETIAFYNERLQVLKDMGYSSYDAYLNSDLWKDIRHRCLTVNPTCKICDGVATQVHHLSYCVDTLEGRRPNNLVSVCRECHEKIEIPQGDKSSPQTALTRTLMMLEKARCRRLKEGKKGN